MLIKRSSMPQQPPKLLGRLKHLALPSRHRHQEHPSRQLFELGTAEGSARSLKRCPNPLQSAGHAKKEALRVPCKSHCLI